MIVATVTIITRSSNRQGHHTSSELAPLPGFLFCLPSYAAEIGCSCSTISTGMEIEYNYKVRVNIGSSR